MSGESWTAEQERSAVVAWLHWNASEVVRKGGADPKVCRDFQMMFRGLATYIERGAHLEEGQANDR